MCRDREPARGFAVAGQGSGCAGILARPTNFSRGFLHATSASRGRCSRGGAARRRTRGTDRHLGPGRHRRRSDQQSDPASTQAANGLPVRPDQIASRAPSRASARPAHEGSAACPDTTGDCVTLQRAGWPARRRGRPSPPTSTRRHVHLHDRVRRQRRYKVAYSGGTDGPAPPSLRPSTAAHQGLAQPAQHGRDSPSGAFYRGNVDPGWGHKPVTIQKKNCAADLQLAHLQDREDERTGGYIGRISAPRSGRLVLPLDREGRPSPAFVRGHRRSRTTPTAAYAARRRRRHRQLTHTAPHTDRPGSIRTRADLSVQERGQTTVHVSPPPIRPASRSCGESGAAEAAVAICARAWSSYVDRSTWRKMPIGDWLR